STVEPIVRISQDRIQPARQNGETYREARMRRCDRQGEFKPRASRLRHGLRVAALAGAALVNSGCITTGLMDYVHNGFKVGPNYCRPPAPVAEEWIEGKDPRANGTPPRDGDWWEVFQDPT